MQQNCGFKCVKCKNLHTFPLILLLFERSVITIDVVDDGFIQ